MRLQGRRTLVTGAATGIGREIARRFAMEGAHVIAVDWDPEGNRETAALIASDGGSCEALVVDVGSEADVIDAFRSAGVLDVLVNNAASVQGDGRLTELSGENWDRVLTICLKSVFLCTREALKSMLPKRAGSIVNLSSVNALAGVNLAAYSAAKGGILSLTRLTAAHYASQGIRANAICPGTIMSESSEQFYGEHPDIEADLRTLYPAGEFGKVQDIADCALFLASDEASFINGITLPVDGGMLATRPLSSLTPKPL
jgi:NAD(P)-dependent dehydrogenase (short-subunit alcohol dehydrogenase family)